jgi:hypothetical protein
MRTFQSIFVALGLASSTVIAAPNFNVTYNNNSLFVSFAHKGLVERVSKEVRELYSYVNPERVVIVNAETPHVVVQFFDFSKKATTQKLWQRQLLKSLKRIWKMQS